MRNFGLSNLFISICFSLKILRWSHITTQLSALADLCWFLEARNKDRSQIFLSPFISVELKIFNELVMSGNRVKQFDFHIGGCQSFDLQIEQLCKKDSKKLHDLSRVTKFYGYNNKTSRKTLHSITIAF